MNTKKLVQGAMIVALFGVMGILNVMTGTFFDSLIGYVMVIPLTWYGYQYGLKNNMIVSFASTAITLMQGMPYFFTIVVYSCILGCFIGEALKEESAKTKIILGSFIISIIYNILLFELLGVLLGISWNQDITELLKLKSLLVNIPYAGMIYRSIDLLSFFVVFISFFESYLILLMIQFIFTRLKLPFHKNYHISTFYLDKKIGYITIGIFIIFFILEHYFNYRIIHYILSLSIFILMINGISLISLYFIYISKPHLNSTGLVLMAVPVINIGLIGLGIIDIISDLRGKIMYNKHRGTSYD